MSRYLSVSGRQWNGVDEWNRFAATHGINTALLMRRYDRNLIPTLQEAPDWELVHVDPRNGLCLARTHHAAFDRGYISFASDRTFRISNEMKKYLPSPILENEFMAYEGHPRTTPERYPPAPGFLDYHRKNIYLG